MMTSEVSSSRTLFSLRPKTPDPSKDYNFNIDGFVYWVERQSFLTDDVRDALKDLGPLIRRVSFVEFSKALNNCLKKLPNGLLERAEVLGSAHKSNQWVAEIARSYMKPSIFSYKELGHDHASAITKSLMRESPECWANEYVLFDDASFSGNQMTGHLNELVKVFERSFSRRDIYVVVPFVTSVAISKISKIKAPPHVHIHMIYEETVPTLRMQMKEESFAALNLYVEEDFSSEEEVDKGVATIYFDHKVPNAQSFALSRIQRECAPSISPPYLG